MTNSENFYRRDVFLSEIRDCNDRDDQRLWKEHQSMQISFLQKRGLQPSSRVLDLGCGPMRLGVALIPMLSEGRYFGQDINPETLVYGEEVLRQKGITEDAPYTLFASDQFDLSTVDCEIDIAFSNSLFSHLTLNSILTCLLRVKDVLAPKGIYYSTFFALERGASWLQPCSRDKWGRRFDTYSYQDPYHYEVDLLKAVASQAGFRMDLLTDFGHPTQTMARFRQLNRSWL